MSSWKTKLDRLDGGPPRRASSESATPPAKPEGADAPAEPSPARPSLDALRDRVAAILARTTQPAPRRVETREVERGAALPFDTEETPLGPLHTRTWRLSPAHRVGRAPVAAWGEASPAMLALLALDPALAACDPARALFVDTETTGLAGGTGTVPFLIGLAWLEEEGRLCVEQLLVRQLGEEAPALARLGERVTASSMLVSFNGKSFDLPLLRTRRVMARLPPLDDRPHLDLLHVARRVHRGRLGGYGLGALEAEVLGFERDGDIPSAEIVSRYAHYLRTGDESVLLAVVEHNAWDVISMPALAALYGEPLGGLEAGDLVGVARTLRRARALGEAEAMAQAAVDRGAGDPGLRVRGEIAKARGDRSSALADFSALVGGVDDPALRLELAKLYEHHARDPLAALAMVERGTGEGPEATERRRARLLRRPRKG